MSNHDSLESIPPDAESHLLTIALRGRLAKHKGDPDELYVIARVARVLGGDPRVLIYDGRTHLGLLGTESRFPDKPFRLHNTWAVATDLT